MVKHDSGGFLVGEPVDPKDLVNVVDIWEQIRDDIASIKSMVSGRAADTRPSVVTTPNIRNEKIERASALAPVTRNRNVEAPSNAKARADISAATTKAVKTLIEKEAKSTGAKLVATPVGPSKTASVTKAQESESARPVARRDASGRFTKGDGGEHDGEDGIASNSLFAEDNAAHKIGKAVAEATRSADDVDPAIKAFHEVMAPITGVTNAVSGLGGNKDPERRSWFRRIFGELKSFREEETAYSRASARSLKGIEKKPKEGGGILSAIMGLLMRIPLIGGLLAGGGLMAGGGLLSGLLGGVMKGGAGLMKRIPVLGAALSSLGGLLDIFSSENDDSLTRGEKDVKTGKASGGIMGTLGGMWAGAKLGAAVGALGGPIGAAIGGVVGGAAGMFFGDKAGQVIGEKVGGWVAALREADIAGFFKDKWESITGGISSAWDSTTGFFKGAWETVTTGLGNAWDSSIKQISETFNSVMTSIFGEKWEDIANWVGDKWSETTESITSAWNTTTEFFSKKWESALSGIGNFFKKVGDKVSDAANAANDFIEDKTGINVKEAVGSTIEKVGDTVDTAKQTVSDTIDATKKAVSDTIETTKKMATDAVDSMKKGVKDVSDAIKGLFSFGGGDSKGSGGSSGGGGASGGYAASTASFNTGSRAEGKAALVEAMDQAGMSDEEKAALMGNVAAESGFVPQSENLAAYANTSNERIRKIFVSKTRNLTEDQLTALKQDPEKFGNHVYSHLGGYKYRGRGHIQLTGVDNYRRYSRQVFGDDRLVDNPDLANDPKVAAQLAVAYQKDRAHPLAKKLYGKDFNDLTSEQMQHVTTQAVAGEGNNLNKGYLADLTRKKQGYSNTFLAEMRAGDTSANIATAAPTVDIKAPAPAVNISAPHGETVTAHAPSATAMAAVAAPISDVPPAPAVHTPINSTDKKDSQQVVLDAPDAGQDVRDRNIAHIVTGGIGA